MKNAKKTILILVLFMTGLVKSQNVDNTKLMDYWKSHDVTKEAKFSKYIEMSHGDVNFSSWKKENRFLYIKEVWYYSESFYIKRNYFADGSVSIDGNLNTYSIDESQIDISRFELNRKKSEEAIVILPGFKDVIVMLPSDKLIYKP